ncbi:MAG: response regulator transcription factor [Lachnospiraceae bacterium]|nr:response regulator transcription factor [Lachnospiraceae bacterium]
MKKIAVIEDDMDICNMIGKFLKNYNYEVCYASDGNKGVELCQSFLPDLIILDLMLPILSGVKVLKELRTFTDNPVIVVSAKTMVQSKIELLHLGADDYMTKPFNLFELLARIEANLKRNVTEIPKTDIRLSYKDIQIENYNVYIVGNPVRFTSIELDILILLLQYPQKIFSKQNLYESIWQEGYAYDNDTINTHISNIRKKIKKYTDTEYIETIWGIGYKLK